MRQGSGLFIAGLGISLALARRPTARRVGKANGSRECAPDDRLRAPTITSNYRWGVAYAPLPTLRSYEAHETQRSPHAPTIRGDRAGILLRRAAGFGGVLVDRKAGGARSGHPR